MALNRNNTNTSQDSKLAVCLDLNSPVTITHAKKIPIFPPSRASLGAIRSEGIEVAEFPFIFNFKQKGDFSPSERELGLHLFLIDFGG
jgi:hypothetical protein